MEASDLIEEAWNLIMDDSQDIIEVTKAILAADEPFPGSDKKMRRKKSAKESKQNEERRAERDEKNMEISDGFVYGYEIEDKMVRGLMEWGCRRSIKINTSPLE